MEEEGEGWRGGRVERDEGMVRRGGGEGRRGRK